MPTSSITAATPGTASSTSLGSSCPSASETGPMHPMHDDQRGLVLEAGELVVQASADHAEVVAVAAVVAKADKLAVEHRRAGVGHADHVAASEEAVVIVAMTVEVDVQAFDLDGQVVGEGVLDAAAHRISDVIVVAIVAEEAEARGGRRDEAAREGSARSGNVVVEARADEGRAVRDAGAEGAETAEVVATVAVREGDAAGGEDQQAVDGVAETAAHRGEPVDAVAAEAVAKAVEAVEQRHVALRAETDKRRRCDAESGDSRRNVRRREDAGPAAEAAEAEDVVVPMTAEVDGLDVGFDADHPAGARRELVVVADLAAAGEAAIIPAVIEAAEAECVESGQRHHRRKRASRKRRHVEAAAAEAVEAETAEVVAVLILEGAARVHADVEAGPSEHRNWDVGSRSDDAARQVGRQGAPAVS